MPRVVDHRYQLLTPLCRQNNEFENLPESDDPAEIRGQVRLPPALCNVAN